MAHLGADVLDYVAKRLVERSEGKEIAADDAGSVEPWMPSGELRLPDFAKVEKNLASIGFFTPSKKKIKDLKKKRISFVRIIGSKRVEVSATILPSAEYGLPTTSDQDKYLAFMKLVTELKLREGIVRNPVGFSSRQMLHLLGIESAGGKVYDEITDWMKRMTLTGISSEGVVYFAGKKSWATDTFHVFVRAVATGREMPDGTKADRHYIWLSEWQLENINNNHLLPVDLEAYRLLRNHIAKGLVPLLQIWLYASRNAGVFEKRYDELCEILSTRPYTAISRIREQLGPSLDELTTHGYLASWKVERTADLSGFKVLLVHGEKFYREMKIRQAASPGASMLPASDPQSSSAPPSPDPERPGEPDLLEEMRRRGIPQDVAGQLLRQTPKGQEILDQLEWGEFLIAQGEEGRGKKKYNPIGFYIDLITRNVVPPENFETTRRRRAHDEARRAHSKRVEKEAALQNAYSEYRRLEVTRHLETAYTPEEYEKLLKKEEEESVQEDRGRFRGWKADTIRTYVTARLRAKIDQQLPLLDLRNFAKRERNMSLPFDEAAHG